MYHLARPGLVPICVPGENWTVPENFTCFVTGWSQTPSMRYKSKKMRQKLRGRDVVNRGLDVLQEVDLPVRSLETCRDVYSQLVNDVHICAGKTGKVFFNFEKRIIIIYPRP